MGRAADFEVDDYQGQVQKLVRGGQAEERGVRRGWRVLAVQGREVADGQQAREVLAAGPIGSPELQNPL